MVAIRGSLAINIASPQCRGFASAASPATPHPLNCYWFCTCGHFKEVTKGHSVTVI
jgi:hypothetical protein